MTEIVCYKWSKFDKVLTKTKMLLFSKTQCTFLPLIFLHCRPFSCLRRTCWDGIKQMHGEGESRGKLANSGLPRKMAIKSTCVCVCVCVLVFYSSFLKKIQSWKNDFQFSIDCWLVTKYEFFPIVWLASHFKWWGVRQSIGSRNWATSLMFLWALN